MKFRKSTLSILLMLTLFISTISSSFAFAADTVDYLGAVDRMKQLEIIDSSVATKVMTRGEFAKAVVIASNLIDESREMKGSTIFADIASNSELSGYVNILLSKNKQLISGMVDGKFHAEAGITYLEVCSVLVKLLGYADSDLTGIWPGNYLSKAQSLKITDDLDLKKSDKVTIMAAAVMFDRLLSTKVNSGSANGTNNATGVIFSDSVKLFSDCIVQDNSLSNDNLASNEVLTDKGILSVADNNIKLQVGPTYRLKIEDGEITKVYGKVRETSTITANTIVGNIIYYEEDGTEKSMTLPASISYYYHGEKKDYTTLSSFLSPNSSIIFDYNTKVASSYAVITDPIYSKPNLTEDFDAKSDKLADITFDSNTKIIKNGRPITKADIKDRDVVYSITDINGNNGYVLVVENYMEGNITAIPTDPNSSFDIKIDAKDYSYSNDMNNRKLESFTIGDLVSIILGYDGKVVDIRSIENKAGVIGDYVILGNSKTSDNLADNEILTDKGTLTFMSGVNSFDMGATYKLYVNDNIITEVDKKQNTTENYVVTEKTGLDMKWENDNDEIISMKLPMAKVYYYHGDKVNYNSAVAAISAFSSIILSKSSNNAEYEYGVIIDPSFSAPKVYRYYDTEFFEQLQNSKYSNVYINEMYNMEPDNISDSDVVYFVSDIWNKNSYIYAHSKRIDGFIESFTPSKMYTNGIKIDNQSYEFSKYFDKTKLNSYYTGNFIKLIIGVDGKVVDIY